MSYLRRFQITDIHGAAGEFSQVRDFRVAEPYRLVGIPFEGTTIDTSFWTSAVSGAGAANTQVSGMITTASGTANSGYAQMQSVRKARFVFGQPHIVRQIIRIPTVVVALNTRRWGSYVVTSAPTPSDGFWFELSAAGALSVNAVNGGGAPTSVASGTFNGEAGTSYTVDTNAHAYEIHYYVFGVEFYIDNVKIHTITPTTANLSGLYSLNDTWASVNSASGTTSGTMEMWSTSITRVGREYTNPIAYCFANGQVAAQVLKRSAGIVRGVSIGQATNNAQIALYDAVTATNAIATWVVPNNSIIPVNMTGLDIPFYTGLTLAVSVQNAGLTVIYE